MHCHAEGTSREGWIICVMGRGVCGRGWGGCASCESTTIIYCNFKLATLVHLKICVCAHLHKTSGLERVGD